MQQWSKRSGGIHVGNAGGTEPLVRVDDDFEDEYPGADALATECFANLWRAGDLLMDLHTRHTYDEHRLSASARDILAIVG